MTLPFIESLAKRRSIYSLGKNVQLSPEEITKIIEECLRYTPSAFNMPTCNVIVSFGDKHDAIWTAAQEILQEKMKKKPEAFEVTRKKIDGFKGSIGTILFYEDTSVVKELKETYAMYADNFDIWSQQACGMLQANIWTALADSGVGANLQHYNPLIDDKMKALFTAKIKDDWKLIAQMPFGSIEQQPKEKYFESLGDRLSVY